MEQNLSCPETSMIPWVNSGCVFTVLKIFSHRKILTLIVENSGFFKCVQAVDVGFVEVAEC